jgi:hypothetical protein
LRGTQGSSHMPIDHRTFSTTVHPWCTALGARRNAQR